MAALNVFENFVTAVHANEHTLMRGFATKVGSLHCVTCGDSRKMMLSRLWLKDANQVLAFTARTEADVLLTPSLHQLVCVECETSVIAMIFEGPRGPELAMFPNKEGGLATKHTPKEVGYYLDQAWRSQCVGANSAAVVMYRSALEHLLREQGYSRGNLYDRIEKVGEDADAGKGPGWVRRTPHELLHALRELGNGAVHTNDGDISKQAAFDTGLLAMLNAVIRGLLEEVYERGERNKAIHADLEEAAKVFKKAKGS